MKAPGVPRPGGLGKAAERARTLGSRTTPRSVHAAEASLGRGLGVPAIFTIGTASAALSIYVSLGLVAGEALGLTPVVFLIAAAFFAVTAMTYVEGTSVHAESGGASTLARYAANEAWSFVAGWAILLDYLIVIAIGAFAISHHLVPLWAGARGVGAEVTIAAAALIYVVRANVRGISAERMRVLLRIALVNLLLLAFIVLIGLATMFELGPIVDSIELGSSPRWRDVAFASVLACFALTGVEAASGLAGEIKVDARGLRRVVAVGTGGILALFVGVSLVALAAVPVRSGSTELGGRYIEAPVLGVVEALRPVWLADGLGLVVGLAAALLLVRTIGLTMRGLSRLGYTLAVNRQIPFTLGRLHPRHGTPHVIIVMGGLLAFGLLLSGDVEFMAGLFAFGAMLAFFIAHVSLIVLRFREPDAPRAFRVPLSVPVGRGSVPIPAVLGALFSGAAWVSVLVFHEGARVVGTGWIVAGLVLFVVYRRSQGESLTQRVQVSPRALQEGLQEIEYARILVPVFGGPLDDEIIGTAGRLAAVEGEEGEGAVIEAVHVVELPMAVPLDAPLAAEREGVGDRVLARAKEVGEEYRGVRVVTTSLRARRAGAAIVEQARRQGVEAIVLAVEEQSRLRGSTALGGRASSPRDRCAGDVTRYVLEKSPCRVVLTAAPEGEEGSREGVAP